MTIPREVAQAIATQALIVSERIEELEYERKLLAQEINEACHLDVTVRVGLQDRLGMNAAKFTGLRSGRIPACRRTLAKLQHLGDSE